MTDAQANKLVLMITYNFAGFLPADIQGASVKKGTWAEELKRYDYKPAEQAVREMIKTLHYPPQIADFEERIGIYTREEQAKLPGPVYEFPKADPEHVERVFQQLMRDL